MKKKRFLRRSAAGLLAFALLIGGNGPIYNVKAAETANSAEEVENSDTETPVGGIIANETKTFAQSVTLKATDNVGISSYYFGTMESPTDSDFEVVESTKEFEVQKTIAKKGVYYFFAKDAAGNISEAQLLTCYKLSLNLNGGSVTVDEKTQTETLIIVKAKGSTVELPVPKKENCQFSSWDGFIGEYTINGDKELTAGYDKTEYTLSYDLDGGQAENPGKYTGEKEITLKEPTKDGYIFVGWICDGAADTDPVKTVIIPAGTTGNKKYTAKYVHVYDYDSDTDTLTMQKVTKEALTAAYKKESTKNIVFSDAVNNIAETDFSKFSNLQKIEIKSEKADYAAENGLLYSPDKTILMYCPIKNTDIKISTKCKTIESNAFKGTLETKYIIPYSVTTIKAGAFSSLNKDSVFVIKNGKTLFEKGAIPAKIKEIQSFEESTAAEYCKTMHIPFSSISEIGKGFFENETSLETFTVTENIKSIGLDAFKGTSLKTIVFSGMNTQITGENTIPSNTVMDCYYGSSAAIYATKNERALKLKIGYDKDKTENISSLDAKLKNNLNEVSFGPILKSISAEALAGCKNLKTITFDEKSVLEAIGDSAFSSSSLIKIELPNSVKSLGANAFKKCTELESADIGSVKNIPDNAFEGCSKLKSVKGNVDWESIGNNAFAETVISDFVANESLCSIGENVFPKTTKSIEIKNPNCKFPNGNIACADTVIKGYENSTADNYVKGHKTLKFEAYTTEKANKITLDFTGGNNDAENCIYVIKGKKVPCVSVPTKKGYAFKGYEDSTGVKYFDEFGKPIKDIWEKDTEMILYAVWGHDTYKVMYNGNGADNGKMEDQVFIVDKYEPLNNNQFQKSGYTFLGWSPTRDSVKAEYTNECIVKNIADKNTIIVLYAVWAKNNTEYTVLTKTQKADGSYEEQEVKKYAPEGIEISMMQDIDYVIPQGYHINTENSVLKNIVQVTENKFVVTLDRDLVVVSYNDNYAGGNITKGNAQIWGNLVDLTKQASPIRKGYKFLGWGAAANATKNDILKEITPNYNGVSVYAVWEKVSSINNGNGSNNGTTVITPEPTKPIKQTHITKGYVYYQVTGNNVIAKKVTNKNVKSVTIAATVILNGKKYTVTSIAKNAFKGCKKLKKVIIKATKLKSIGKNAFKGIYKKATFKVPKKQLKKYKKLIQKKKTGFVKTMKVKK